MEVKRLPPDSLAISAPGPSPSTPEDTDADNDDDNLPHIVSQLCSSEHHPDSLFASLPDLNHNQPDITCVDPGFPGLSFLDDHIPHALAAGSHSNPDTLSQSAMLKADDRDEFLKCQPDEINGLHDADVFEYMKFENIPPQRRQKILNAIWSYRRKRRPDGSLLKHKCRICADSSRQEH